LGPQAGAAGELEDLAGRVKALQGVLRFGRLSEPPGARLGAVVVASAAEPPVVVLAGAFAVVVRLLSEELVDVATP
jgi:hypothetical protein